MANSKQAKAQPVASRGSGQLKRGWSRNHLLAISSITVAILVAIGLIISLHDHKRTAACSGTSGSLIVSQAFNLLTPDQTTELASVVTKIKQLPNYQKDPNCMYIVTMYYANKFDNTNAQSSLAQFNKDYTGQTLNPILTKFASVAILRSSVANISRVLQQDQRNAAPLVPGSKAQ